MPHAGSGSSAPAIRAAAEKLSGATTATPAPMTVKPSTATGQVGAKTTTARPQQRDHGADPQHAHRAVPRDEAVAGEPDGAAGEQVGERRERDQVGRRVEDVVEVLGPQVNAAVSTM